MEGKVGLYFGLPIRMLFLKPAQLDLVAGNAIHEEEKNSQGLLWQNSMSL